MPVQVHQPSLALKLLSSMIIPHTTVVKVDMYLKVCALYVILGVTFAAENLEKNSPCLTPNAENGTCISVNACKPIKQAVAYFNQDSIEFARQSQCGYEDGPLVCCGSVGRITSFTQPTTLAPVPTKPPPAAAPVDNILLPDRSLCGLHITENVRETGKTTEITEFPWLVALKYTKNDGTPGGFRCTGTLINHRYVLTAAQCLSIPGFDLTAARLGEWKFSTKDCIANLDYEDTCEDPVMDLMVIEKISHPYYNNRSGNNNIAILRLEKDIKYNNYIRAICLPPSDYPPPPAETPMETSGWNITALNGVQSDVQLKSMIYMVGSEECNEVYPNYIRAYPNKACAGGKKRGNLCDGNSGSPLMRTYERHEETEEEQWFQEGIIHEVSGCEEKSGVALYTRVSRYLSWILNNLNQ